MTNGTVPWLRRYWTAARVTVVAAACLGGTAALLVSLTKHVRVDSWLIWSLLPLWGYTLLFVGSCLSAGNAVLRALLPDRSLPPVEWVLQSMTAGLVTFVLGVYGAGALGQLSPGFAVGWCIALLAIGARPARASWRRFAEFWDGLAPVRLERRLLYSAMAVWGSICIGFVYLGALHDSAINFDAGWYHLPIAQDYAREGAIIPFPGENHRAYPHLASIVQTWALLVPGLAPVALRWILVLHLEFAIVLFRILGVVAAAQYFLTKDRTPALWVSFFLFPSIFIYDQNIGGAADQWIAFSAVPVFLALARSLPALDPRHLTMLGIAIGCHVLTKYQAIFLVVPTILLLGATWIYFVSARLLATSRRRVVTASVPTWRRLWLAPVILAVVAGTVTSPHFVKNVAFYGNPVYPFATRVFPHSHPVQPPELYRLGARTKNEFISVVDPQERLLWATKLPFVYSFQTRNRDLTDYRPYMGFLFSLLLPCLPFIRRSRQLWLGFAVSGLAFVSWGFATANDRYLLSFYGIPIGMTAALLVRVWELGWIARIGLVPLVAVQLSWGGEAMFTYGGQRVRAAMKLIESGYSEKTAAERFSSRLVEQRITAATPSDARILSRNYKGLLGLDRLVLSDIREAQGYITYSGMRSPRQMWEQLRGKGITHLLYPEGRRRPHRLNNTVLFGALVHEAPGRRSFGGLVLVPLPSTPPPDQEPYLVLVQGVREFPDGLYRVEQLDLDDRHAARVIDRPRPMERLRETNAEQLVGRAHAVAGQPRLDGAAGDLLRAEFALAESFGGYALYLRGR